MGKFKPRTRNGQVIKNYIKRTDFVLPGCANGVKVPNDTSSALEKSLKNYWKKITRRTPGHATNWPVVP